MGVGRNPTPTELKILRGNPGHRPLNDKEPKPKVKLADPPSYLNVRAKREWRKIGKRLLVSGIITELDETALASYCQAFSLWVEAVQAIEEDGAVFETLQGQKRSPWVGIANDAWKEMARMLGEFGMTPSSRSKINVEKPADDEEDWFGIRKN